VSRRGVYGGASEATGGRAPERGACQKCARAIPQGCGRARVTWIVFQVSRDRAVLAVQRIVARIWRAHGRHDERDASRRRPQILAAISRREALRRTARQWPPWPMSTFRTGFLLTPGSGMVIGA